MGSRVRALGVSVSGTCSGRCRRGGGGGGGADGGNG